ncbi:MAG: diadenylate cyclase CdaA [Clostridia bacterium]
MALEYFLGLFSNITFVDVLDMVIVSYIIYRAILMFKQTRAMALVKGILVLLVVTVIADLLNTTTLSWLLNSLWTIGIIAIVILFQPEIRKALEQFGRTGIMITPSFKQRPETEVNDAIEEVIKAISVLSKNKIGALIVWERETGIRDYMETGIPIDSLVSSSLLINIFIPKTPLHDGAVMIRKGRVVAAACYLPLTSNTDLSKELGTRHRAAIGISEYSDAVAIVVSEETGTISLAVDGKIQRYLDTSTLKEKLYQYLIEDHQERVFDKLWKGSNHEEK